MSEHTRRSGAPLAPDGPLMSGLARMTMVLTVGFLWTLTSLPVITVGASSSAAYYVLMKSLRGEEEHYLKDYFRAFCRDFKQATVAWLLLLVIGGILGLSVFYYRSMRYEIAEWLGFVFVALLAILLVVMIYVFPIISRFANSFGNILMMAFVLPFKNLKWTIALVLMAAAVALICIYFTPLIFFGYGLFVFGSSYIFMKIFKPLETSIEDHTNDDHSAE